ncbi:hypothetical protein TREMEDRAFT_44861 [Tremella mesenterica DSM 1558]|uniref:uncharacterized protein n=1 Tax=Tremella mesenterica (strain ATCC 24925 / CBS 8224 / DSM 1558 / NBRC 9311 / NRRL Y-6157 / RJB 2259-6 / UBC 559-6) TaxID=578456 RepID=UPI0003F4A5B8|nr:uncharacterized protein TREMEDRAFT_44861 [Tremella mesenterica DSM 1558]EIW67846.1 hypothetical protein TREMEDRAFT_44861 [Tremella mesenterica DSM 1558]
MSVEISPANQLGFPRPLTTTVKRSILLHNPHSAPVAFKVKTTAPKQYCVRPNSGRIEPGENVEVQVLLQPLPVEPPPHAKCKDKFLVQSAYIAPDSEMHSLAEMWMNVERANKSAISEHKIKVAYLPPEDGSGNVNGIPEEQEAELEQSRLMDESHMYAAAESSPVATRINGDHSPVVPTSPANGVHTPEKPIPVLGPGDVIAVGASPTNIALEQGLAATQSDSEKLSIALKELDSLRAQLAEAQGPQVTGLRRRGGPAPTNGTSVETAVEKAKDVVQNVGTQGVPVEVVAALVVGVFVMTYLFF